MNQLESSLYDFMIQNHIDPDTADAAARNCARTVERSAIAGFVLGTGVGIATMNPSALLMGGVGAAAGGGLALAISPTCSEIRNAVQQWATSATELR
jgi:hypothetical protein